MRRSRSFGFALSDFFNMFFDGSPMPSSLSTYTFFSIGTPTKLPHSVHEPS
jgi:hypothetical protein